MEMAALSALGAELRPGVMRRNPGANKDPHSPFSALRPWMSACAGMTTTSLQRDGNGAATP